MPNDLITAGNFGAYVAALKLANAQAAAGGGMPALTGIPGLVFANQGAAPTMTPGQVAALADQRAAAAGDLFAQQQQIVGAQWDHHDAAVAGASALGDMYEGRRPNCWVAGNTATPTVAIGAAASTGTISFTIPAYTEIVLFSFTDADAADFLLEFLRVNGWDMNKGGAFANLAMFMSVAERYNAPAPLIGRVWKGTIAVSFACTNVNAATRIFHGLTIWGYNGECLEKFETDSAEVMGFHSWTSVLARTQQSNATMGIRPVN